MSEPTTADLLGLPLAALEFEGQTYPLREATLEERGRYQRWLEDELRATTARNVDSPDPDGDRMRDSAAIAGGACEFDGEIATARRRTWTGQAKLYEIMYGLEPDYAERLVKANADRIAEVFRRAVIDHDPKAQRQLLGPLLRAVGLPLDFLASWSGPSSTSTARRPSKPSKGSRSRSSGASGGRTAAAAKRVNSPSPKPAAPASAAP